MNSRIFELMDECGSSWSSGFQCSDLGVRHGSRAECPGCYWANWCESMYSISSAPLCMLPQYMASRYRTVRRAAKARFVELEEAELLKNPQGKSPHLGRKKSTVSHKI